MAIVLHVYHRSAGSHPIAVQHNARVMGKCTPLSGAVDDIAGPFSCQHDEVYVVLFDKAPWHKHAPYFFISFDVGIL